MNKIREIPSKFIVKIKDNNTNEEYEKWIITKDISKKMNEFTASNPNTSWEIIYEYRNDKI